jgi:putative YhbY family RNA-binding protein
LDKKRIVELRGKAQSLPSTVYVGKEGATQEVAAELARQLKKNKLVKAKLLHSVGRERVSIAEELAKGSDSVLIEVRGKTVVLAKE